MNHRLDKMDRKLISLARDASDKAYSPYSGYRVGVALQCKNGDIFTGCNIEISSYSLTICAERSAAIQAVSSGCKDFSLMAVYVDSDDLFYPCGACRQFLWEFSEDLSVIVANRTQEIRTTLKELFPSGFKLNV